MGLVIFTGFLIGTMFTLFVVPMFYTLISKSDAEYRASKTKQEDMFRKTDKKAKA